MRNQIIGVTWDELCERVCTRFNKDRQQALIRQWIKICQVGSVAEYVEKFDSIMHQMMAYDPTLKPVYFVTKFVEGLRHEVRSAVIMQRPSDLDAACALALLQEEALESDKGKETKKAKGNFVLRSGNRVALPLPLPPTVKGGTPIYTEERRVSDNLKGQAKEHDRLASLKSYRRAKGLCFVCGERWGKDHKCASSIQLYVVQELLDVLQSDSSLDGSQILEQQYAEDTLMAISQQAVSGTESGSSIRLRGWVQGTEVLMLIDSGSTHSFVDKQIGLKLMGVKALKCPAKVKIADGGELTCSWVIPDCDWYTQGVSFKTDFRLLPLGNYDAILGMDWLSKFNPMHVNWSEKWVEFNYWNKLTRLQGVQANIEHCQAISTDQLAGLVKTGSVMYMVQLATLNSDSDEIIPAEVQGILDSFQEDFLEPSGLPPKRLCDHHIPLIPGAKPVFLKPYRHNPGQKDEIERQVKEMLQNGVIQPSTSAFSSPALLVKKKDGTWRVCIDYR